MNEDRGNSKMIHFSRNIYTSTLYKEKIDKKLCKSDNIEIPLSFDPDMIS
jgi:hypothetical protein